MSDFWILEGHTPKPVESLEEWAKHFERTNRQIGDTDVGGVRISTVFLGVDHQHFDGPPLLFETMIFGGEHDQYQERCSTWAQAEAQHEAACALVRGNRQ